ncbi:MAG: cupin domain-containing protein [Deltaproteobacteria bacterium]|nr:cupin domain-containing protein [Deltaproteobacteria bacterium]
MSCPAFPGAIGVSHLRVYDSVAPDGLRGGTPHVHSVCSEAYLVVAGRGAVQTLGPAGYRELPLEPGAFVWFTPGTIHRLVNGDGALEIVVLMQNAELPEAGDMVITFAPETLDDPEAYAAAATLPEFERTTIGSGDAAREGLARSRGAGADRRGARHRGAARVAHARGCAAPGRCVRPPAAAAPGRAPYGMLRDARRLPARDDRAGLRAAGRALRSDPRCRTDPRCALP